MVDPFGGIQGRKFENISGFLIDKEESLKIKRLLNYLF
jgi:hypothetical protein